MQFSRAYSGLLRVVSKKQSKDLSSFFKYNFASGSDQPLILGIDQSTTTTKINIYDTKSNNLFSEMRSHKQITPHSGWLEHNPLEILENLERIAHTATKAVLSPLLITTFLFIFQRLILLKLNVLESQIREKQSLLGIKRLVNIN